MRYHTGENNPRIDLDVDQIAIGRADRGAVENRNAGVCAAARHPIELLIDDSIKSKVAAVHDRYAAARGACQERAVIGEALIGKLAKMRPAADLQSRGKPGVILSAIMPPLKFTDHERGILESKAQAIAIACIGISVAAGSCRVAVEDRKQQRSILRQFILYSRPDRGQWIGRSAAGQVDGADGRPIALQEYLTQVAIKKLGVRRELAKPEAQRTKPAFKPQLRQAHCRRRLDRRDRVHAADIVASDAAVVIDAEGIGVERPVLPAGELVEIDVELRLQLALIDGAAPDTAGHIAQDIICINEIV